MAGMCNSSRIAGAAGLAVGLAMALAANLTYAAPLGPVVVGIGVVAPLVLPLVLWIRTTFEVTGLWARIGREVCVLAVAAPAAALSYWHTAMLMLEHGQPWVLALLAPLSSDGVAGISTMALHWARRAPTTTSSRGPVKRETVKLAIPATQTAGPAPAASTPPPSPAPRSIAAERTTQSARVAWLLRQEPRPFSDEIAAVRREFGVSLSTAKRVRTAAGRSAA